MFFIPFTVLKNISYTPYTFVHIFMSLYLKLNTFMRVYKNAYIKTQERERSNRQE